MSLKSIISTILVILVLSISMILTNTLQANSFNRNAVNNSVIVTSQESYTYERVLINGVWWIIVYGEDGAVIEKYMDPDQD